MNGNLTNTLQDQNVFIRHQLRIDPRPVKGLKVSILAPHTYLSDECAQ